MSRVKPQLFEDTRFASDNKYYVKLWKWDYGRVTNRALFVAVELPPMSIV
jgi:hypothetical protein